MKAKRKISHIAYLLNIFSIIVFYQETELADSYDDVDMELWNSYGLPTPLLRALRECGFSNPTQIQALTLPPAILGNMIFLSGQLKKIKKNANLSLLLDIGSDNIYFIIIQPLFVSNAGQRPPQGGSIYFYLALSKYS